jgi:hypothetical protein
LCRGDSTERQRELGSGDPDGDGPRWRHRTGVGRWAVREHIDRAEGVAHGVQRADQPMLIARIGHEPFGLDAETL